MKSFAIFLCLFVLKAGAATSPQAAAVASAGTASFDSAELTVSFAEQNSSFRLWSEKNQRMVSFVSSSEAPKKGPVSAKDFDFVSRRIASLLKTSSNDVGLCQRSHIRLTVTTQGKSVEKIGCIGSKTPAAKELTALANSLSLLM